MQKSKERKPIIDQESKDMMEIFNVASIIKILTGKVKRAVSKALGLLSTLVFVGGGTIIASNFVDSMMAENILKAISACTLITVPLSLFAVQDYIRDTRDRAEFQELHDYLVDEFRERYNKDPYGDDEDIKKKDEKGKNNKEANNGQNQQDNFDEYQK